MPINEARGVAVPSSATVAVPGRRPMCLAIPMQIVAIDGLSARCEAKGIERVVSLFLLQHETLQPGDMVMIHVGYAIQRITRDEARTAWALYDEMLAADELMRDAQRA
jgi:hydrogenase expression/formation protein HypC